MKFFTTPPRIFPGSILRFLNTILQGLLRKLFSRFSRVLLPRSFSVGFFAGSSPVRVFALIVRSLFCWSLFQALFLRGFFFVLLCRRLSVCSFDEALLVHYPIELIRRAVFPGRDAQFEIMKNFSSKNINSYRDENISVGAFSKWSVDDCFLVVTLKDMNSFSFWL